jgi:glycerol-3-phosphate acyltransferase PlsY
MLAVVLKIVLAYLLGSVSGSLLLGTLRKVDIRDSGSGNAGGTNAFRSQGFKFALGVVVIDLLKGVLATWMLPLIHFSLLGESIPVEYQVLACALAVVAGHCYPLWYGFRGGKGGATAVGALLVIQPLAVPPMLITWLVTLGLTGYVGLATMLAGLAVVPVMLWLDAPSAQVWFAILLGAFIVFTHRSNIQNMIQKTEYRFERARIKNWLG